MLSIKNTSKIKFLYILLFFLGVSISIFFFRNSPPVIFIEGEMQNIFASSKISIFAFGKNKKNESVDTLKKEIDRLNQKMADYEIIKKDNEALRSQFEISGNVTQTLANAKILGFTGDSNLPQTLVINLGEKDGLKKGMSVISQKYLVGKISDISINFSVVETVLNSNFQALAKIPATSAKGIIKGSKDFLLLDRVVITDKLEVGTDVLTMGEVEPSGMGIYPDLILGRITSISKKETSPFQSAQVIPLADLSRLTQVFVIISQ